MFSRGGVAALVAAVSFFALRSSPRLMEIPWLPYWLSSWADDYGVGRNVLAFGVVGLAAFAASAAQPGAGQRTKPEKETEPRGVDGHTAGVALERSGRATDAGCPRGGGGSKDWVSKSDLETGRQEKEKDKENENDVGARTQFWTFVALCVFATGLEVAQLWIPGRWFDWKDIVASLGGIAIAWVVVRLARLGFEFWVLSFGLKSVATPPNAVATGGNGEDGEGAQRRVLEDVAA